MSSWRALWLACALIAVVMAGCLSDEGLDEPTDEEAAEPMVDYEVPEPDPDLGVVELAAHLPGAHPDVEIHVRVARPDVEEPVGVIAEFTPYRLLGQRQTLVEPMVDEPAGTFVREFVKRGFAFAWADVRGTGDSSGCIDLRGSNDIADADRLTEWLGTQDWSNGKVGFIGASYPGSTSHIAGIANNEHLGGIVPVVASTSFYHYQHKGGVPYQNSAGTTNAGYTGFALGPTVNAHNPQFAVNQLMKASCPEHAQHVAVHGAGDTSGEYTAWWHDRNLRWRVDQVEVPVLMAQGLQDWNVEPDQIAHYFNDLQTRKTLVAPQMGHRYADVGDPASGEEDGPYGWWWEFVTAFFDETLNGVHTGLFDEDRAYVQDSLEEWSTYEGSWPPLDATEKKVHLTQGGLSFEGPSSGSVAWEADPAGAVSREEGEFVVLESPTLEKTLHASGTPMLNLTVESTTDDVHLTAVLEYREPGGSEWVRMNWGYLDPVYRHGLDDPRPFIPGDPLPLRIEFHPQEDVFEAGGKIRLVLSSTDGGRTVPAFEPGTVTAKLGDGEHPALLSLPLSPLYHEGG